MIAINLRGVKIAFPFSRLSRINDDFNPSEEDSRGMNRTPRREKSWMRIRVHSGIERAPFHSPSWKMSMGKGVRPRGKKE